MTERNECFTAIVLVKMFSQWFFTKEKLTLKVLIVTIDAHWEGMGDVGSARYEHKGFKLQELINFRKFGTLRVNYHF